MENYNLGIVPTIITKRRNDFLAETTDKEQIGVIIHLYIGLYWLFTQDVEFVVVAKKQSSNVWKVRQHSLC